MRRLLILVATLISVISFHPATAGETFSGTWEIDLRSKAEKIKNIECGTAIFELSQNGVQIVGSHSMATSGCGRINEGGEGTVKGVVIGQTAVLVITSGRNGAIVMGTAKLIKNALEWTTLDEIKAGDLNGDSALILDKGMLSKKLQKSD
ncbi:hypothetical protein ACO0K7_09300 [Undibacterium sp. Ji67W]|uniref:hypothetical protein n=1 Tax=Undibacterium sp. Ji67W TaxID=3413042 RepID=UPI003BF0B81B